MVGILWLCSCATVSGQSTVRFTPPVIPSTKESQLFTNKELFPAPIPSSSAKLQRLDVTPTPLPTERPVVQKTLKLLPVPESPFAPQTTDRSESEQESFAVPQRLQQDQVSIGNVNIDRLPARSPQAMPLPPAIDKNELEKVLHYGLDLEREQRWADVLTHYESALRSFRNDETLMQRFRFARFHYDLGRRFHDSSYLKIVHTSNFIDVLNLYEEIISRIQTNYVDMPHWDDLFRYGVQDAEIALSEPIFRTKSDLKVSNDKVQNYIDAMKQTAAGWEIRNREDLKNGILRLAEIAQQQIGLNPAVLLLEFTCGIVNSLDPYTAYLTPNQLNDTFSMISGNFVGLGVELKSDRESLVIVRVIGGSPAKEAGLKDGDRIYAVDGTSTRGRDTDSAADLLQGEEGSLAKLQILSPGQKLREVQIVRRKVDVPSIEDVKMLTKDLGYIRLTGFQSKTCVELKSALWSLNSQGMKSLVLDLRHNPGGLLQIGVEVANFFLDEGPIVRTRGRHSDLDTPYMATKEDTWKMPLIVLIDEESASASEIVAGAIRDHNRGVIVGHRSYGKGTIQAILSINGGSRSNTPQAGLRLTIEKFYSPQGLPYSGVGVSPHVLVETGQKTVVGRPINGQVPTVASRTISSDLSDPYIRQAIQTAKDMLQ